VPTSHLNLNSDERSGVEEDEEAVVVGGGGSSCAGIAAGLEY